MGWLGWCKPLSVFFLAALILLLSCCILPGMNRHAGEQHPRAQLYAIQQADSRIGFEATNHYFYVPIDLAGAIAQNSDEVWAMLRDRRTYVYVAGLKEISAQFDEAMAKVVGSVEEYEKQRAILVEEGRWAELIY